MKKISLKYLKKQFEERILQKVDKKILIYLVFVSISTVFWFLNKLGNEFNTTIYYPIKYTGIPEDKILLSDLPTKLELQVSALGYNLIKYKFRLTPFPININLSEYSKHQEISQNVRQIIIHTRLIKSDISEQLGKNIKISDILPDTLHCRFANIITKKIPIAANANLQFDAQCMLNGKIQFTPDSVIVKGSEQIIDTLKYIYTKRIKFKKLNKNIERNVSLKKIKNLSIAKKRAIIKIPVSKFTEATLQIPIQVRNVPDSLQLITFPQKASIKYMVSLDECDKITEQDFVLEVNYLDIKKLLGNKLTVKLTHKPDEVKNISFTPNFVEYIIENK